MIVGPMWFLLIIGVMSLVIFYAWAVIESSSCLPGACTGAGLLQGIAITFISTPAIVISTLVSGINLSVRKKKLLPITKSHKALVWTGVIMIVVAVLLLRF